MLPSLGAVLLPGFSLFLCQFLRLLGENILKFIQPFRFVSSRVSFIVSDHVDLIHRNHSVASRHVGADGSAILGVVHHFLNFLTGQPINERSGIFLVGAVFDDVNAIATEDNALFHINGFNRSASAHILSGTLFKGVT